MKVRKIVSLLVWSGNDYKEIASAQAKIQLHDNFRDIYSIILQLPNSGVEFEMVAENTVNQLGNDEFCNTFGIKTTTTEISHLVNGEFPSTSQYTGATSSKSLTSSNLSLSDFFFAQKEEGNGGTVLFSSLLSGDDGADCVLKATIKQSIAHTNGDTNLVVADSSKLAVGMEIEDQHGSHIPSGTTITAIVDSTNITMSAAATNTGSGTATFTTIDVNGGTVDGATIGANSASTGAFTTVSTSGLATLNSVTVSGTSTLTTVDINGGAIDGTPIGANSASTVAATAITGTTVTTTGNINTTGGEVQINGTNILAKAYPVGSIYINATNSTNPATLLGFGTWVAFGAGRVMVGLNSSDTEFDTAEETGGVKEVTLTAAQSGLPSHSHTQLGGGFDGNTGIEAGNQRTVNLGQTGTTGGTSAQQAHTNVQPYIVVYMWKRTA